MNPEFDDRVCVTDSFFPPTSKKKSTPPVVDGNVGKLSNSALQFCAGEPDEPEAGMTAWWLQTRGRSKTQHSGGESEPRR